MSELTLEAFLTNVTAMMTLAGHDPMPVKPSTYTPGYYVISCRHCIVDVYVSGKQQAIGVRHPAVNGSIDAWREPCIGRSDWSGA